MSAPSERACNCLCLTALLALTLLFRLLPAPPVAKSRAVAHVATAAHMDDLQVRRLLSSTSGAAKALGGAAKVASANRITLKARMEELVAMKAKDTQVGDDERIQFLLSQIVRSQAEFNELDGLNRSAGALKGASVMAKQNARYRALRDLTAAALDEVKVRQASAETPELRQWTVPSPVAALKGGIPERFGDLVIVHEAAENDTLFNALLTRRRAEKTLAERLQDLPRALESHRDKKARLKAQRLALLLPEPNLLAGTGHSGLASGAAGLAQKVLYVLPPRPAAALVPYLLAKVCAAHRATAARCRELERAVAGVTALRLHEAIGAGLGGAGAGAAAGAAATGAEAGAAALSVDSFGRHGALRFVRRLLAGKETPEAWAARSGRAAPDVNDGTESDEAEDEGVENEEEEEGEEEEEEESVA